jgi:hypothetical protein
MLLEIDTVRVAVEDAVAMFKADVLPRLCELKGCNGVLCSRRRKARP